MQLTASFPNLVYVVVCDRRQVERALDEDSEGEGYGRDYLEKIVQYAFDLPALPLDLLYDQFRSTLYRSLGEMWPETEEFDEAWFLSVVSDSITSGVLCPKDNRYP